MPVSMKIAKISPQKGGFYYISDTVYPIAIKTLVRGNYAMNLAYSVLMAEIARVRAVFSSIPCPISRETKESRFSSNIRITHRGNSDILFS